MRSLRDSIYIYSLGRPGTGVSVAIFRLPNYSPVASSNCSNICCPFLEYCICLSRSQYIDHLNDETHSLDIHMTANFGHLIFRRANVHKLFFVFTQHSVSQKNHTGDVFFQYGIPFELRSSFGCKFRMFVKEPLDTAWIGFSHFADICACFRRMLKFCFTVSDQFFSFSPSRLFAEHSYVECGCWKVFLAFHILVNRHRTNDVDNIDFDRTWSPRVNILWFDYLFIWIDASMPFV